MLEKIEGREEDSNHQQTVDLIIRSDRYTNGRLEGPGWGHIMSENIY